MLSPIIYWWKEWRLSRKFIVGERYEVYKPMVKELRSTYGITFNDAGGASFTVTSTVAGMLWTNDITYHRIAGDLPPPLAHGTIGCPLPECAIKWSRPVTNE